MKRKKMPLGSPGRIGGPDVPPRPRKRPKLDFGKIEDKMERLPLWPPSPAQKKARRRLHDRLEVMNNGRSRQL